MLLLFVLVVCLSYDWCVVNWVYTWIAYVVVWCFIVLLYCGRYSLCCLLTCVVCFGVWLCFWFDFVDCLCLLPLLVWCSWRWNYLLFVFYCLGLILVRYLFWWLYFIGGDWWINVCGLFACFRTLVCIVLILLWVVCCVYCLFCFGFWICVDVGIVCCCF